MTYFKYSLSRYLTIHRGAVNLLKDRKGLKEAFDVGS